MMMIVGAQDVRPATPSLIKIHYMMLRACSRTKEQRLEGVVGQDTDQRKRKTTGTEKITIWRIKGEEGTGCPQWEYRITVDSTPGGFVGAVQMDRILVSVEIGLQAGPCLCMFVACQLFGAHAATLLPWVWNS